MKRICILLILIFTINVFVFSQITDSKITIQTNPLLLLTDVIFYCGGEYLDPQLIFLDLEGQYKINEIVNISLALSFSYGDIYYLHSDFETVNLDGEFIQLSIKPSLIYRPLRTGLMGFYLGIYPDIGLARRRNPGFGEDYLGADIGFGFTTGYKWISKYTGFTFQVGAGIGKNWFFPKMNVKGTFFDIKSDGRFVLGGVTLLLDFKLGYSF